MTLDPSVQRFLAILGAGKTSHGAVPPVAERRRNFAALLAMAGGAPPKTIVVKDDTVASRGHEIAVRLYAPAGASGSTGPLLLFMHGGGFIAGSITTHDGVCRALAEHSGIRVLSVDYRLSPEHRFPAAIEDGLAVLRAVAATPERFGFDGRRLAIGGDSVGANLALQVYRRAKGIADVTLQFLICPVLDFASDAPSRNAFANGYYLDDAMVADDVANYCPDGMAIDDPRLSPIRDADFASLPPAIIHVAACDPFRDDAIAYVQSLRDAGVDARLTEHAGMIHLFYAFAKLIPRGGVALAQMGRELGERLRASG